MNGSITPETLSQAHDAIATANRAHRLSDEAVRNLDRWLTEPQYEKYVPRILELVANDQFETLNGLFWEVLAFGTGGRRGNMGELGSATVNERTIAESAYGLAVYFERLTGKTSGRAVIACDTRNRSDEFARITACVLAARGLEVYFFESYRSTPELSFAVRHFQCDVGVMVSASHNPPSDNGFKAYWSNGGQILDPKGKDAPNITECVMQAGEIPLVDFDAAVADGRIRVLGPDVDQLYIDAVLAMSLSDAREIPVLFSPLHGVGETSVYQILKQAGFDGVEIFEPHRKADGDFPNVPGQLPNPERKEVFDPLIKHAEQSGAELLLASDPDADRLGVSARAKNGTFVHLSGNRIGALLCDYVLRRRAAAGTLSPEHYVVETLVTTPLIASIAQTHSVRAIDDLLVGFKYIAETMDHEGSEKFVFGAEESLGYLAGQYARDKDAGIAALYLMELAAELRLEGKTLLDRLDELFVQHGYFLEGQRSTICEGPAGKDQIDGLMRKFREKPPVEIAGFRLTRVRDYQRHEVRELPRNQRVDDLPAPSGNLLFFEAESKLGRLTLAVRPSGTEPKIKFYFFAHSDLSDSQSLTELKDRTDAALKQFQDGLSEWVANELASL